MSFYFDFHRVTAQTDFDIFHWICQYKKTSFKFNILFDSPEESNIDILI